MKFMAPVRSVICLSGFGTQHPTGHAPRNPETGRIMVGAAIDQYNDPIQNLAPDAGERTYTTAEDTLTGATSQDVNRGLGAPIQGMSSRQMHTANQQQHRKREHEGAQQYGPQGGQLDLGQSGKARERMPEGAEFVSERGPFS